MRKTEELVWITFVHIDDEYFHQQREPFTKWLDWVIHITNIETVNVMMSIEEHDKLMELGTEEYIARCKEPFINKKE